MGDTPTREAIATVWRIESARLIGGLVRLVQDVDTAEELAQEALLRALEAWPESGVPHNPGAWLMATAKHRALDLLRRRGMLDRKHAEIERGPQGVPADLDAVLDDAVGDDVLRLMLVACHPVLSRDARVALTLRLLGGLATAEIARAFLQPETTVAQRIVRAKRTLAEAHVPFDVPQGEALHGRIESILEVIYLVFNEGYTATAGTDWMRPALCDEALRLGRILAGLAPHDPEVHGLVALMELQASRQRARTGPTGEPITLADQNRARWDPVLIRRGLAALARADQLAAPRGPYALQAAIAACHARAATIDATDWPRIVAIYDALVEVTQSPIVELNRAVAVGMAFGPEEGLELCEKLAEEPALRNYPHLESVRGDLLYKLRRFEAARIAFERAAELTENLRERDLWLGRARNCEPQN